MLVNLDSQASWEIAARRRGDVRLLLSRRLRRRTLTARLLRRQFLPFSTTSANLLYSGRQIAQPIELDR